MSTIPYASMIGFILAFVLILMIVWKTKKNIYGGTTYDERQLSLRGNAYRTAVYVSFFALLLNAMIKEVCMIDWAAPLTEALIIISIGIIASTIQCVIKDAYFPQAFNQRRFVWIYMVIGIMNLVPGVRNLLSGDSFDSQGRFDNVSLIVGILVVLIVIITLIHRLFIAGREEEE